MTKQSQARLAHTRLRRHNPGAPHISTGIAQARKPQKFRPLAHVPDGGTRNNDANANRSIANQGDAR